MDGVASGSDAVPSTSAGRRSIQASRDGDNTKTADLGVYELSNEEDAHERDLAEARKGVDRVEAITQSWSKTSLIIAYVTFWCLYLLFAFERSFYSNIGPYITSMFEEHSLLPTVDLVANIMSGASYLPMAKALNMYGRAEGLVFMAVGSIIGLILTAACTNIETYCAGVVFTTIGFSGTIYAVDVMTADTSMLKSRALAYAFTASPYIITAFGGPSSAQSLLKPGQNWRWGFGALSIVTPAVVAVLFTVLFVQNRKIKQNETPRAKNTQKHNFFQKIWHFIMEFDALGIFILAAGEVLFLLPFSLAEGSGKQWASAHIIVMLVLGFLLLLAFSVVEKYAPVPFAPWKLLASGTLLMVCILNAVFSIADDTWSAYFTSYLQVVYGLSVSHAGWVNGTSGVIRGVWQIVVGIAIRYTGRYKWVLLLFIPIYALFMGLLIYFRRPDTNTGLIVMSQIFLGIASSSIILCVEVGVVATVEHADVAVAIALLGLSGYIGSAIGNAISGAIWTNTLPDQLAKRLPKEQAEAIYGSLKTQLSYPPGDPVRDAIVDAYAIAQTRMLIAGIVAAGIMLFLTVFLKDVRLNENRQVKGMVL
ncbi:hypothetical protein PRZ48_014981 [Zasmidium cellare]|uniref:Major facilitator superfamily (MFS) profile domain-containing protein n=1 Tax=Zasmidium cellare TaxID=395010 RepID=A0ABR0DXX8_ZASCE|nr:hypothetical protein PRZ48_014981 [Zasmidium cellare]